MSLWGDIKHDAGDFLHGAEEVGSNLLADAGDFATGFFPGLYDVGKAVAHDAGEGIDRATGSHLTHGTHYDLDNIGHAILEQYKYTYKPALDGDWGLFGQRLKEHPLGPILDVLTVLTGGAGALGKVGKLASEAGTGGVIARAGAKAAGYRAIPKSVMDLPASRLLREKYKNVHYTDNAGTMYVPQRRMLYGQMAGKDMGSVATNPAIRARQSAYDKLGERYPTARVVGADGRVQRKKLSEIHFKEMTEKHRVIQANKALLKSFSTHEKTAFMVLAGGHRVADLIDFYRARLQDAPKKAVPFVRKRIKQLESPKVAALVAEPTSKLTDALAAAERVSALTTGKLKKAGVNPRHDVAFLEQDLVGTPMLAHLQSRIAVKEQVIARQRAKMGKARPNKRKGLAAEIARHEEELGALRGQLDDIDLAPAGVPIKRPHTTAPRAQKAAQSMVSGRAPSFRRAQRSGSMRYNTGTNFSNAMDSLHPANIIRAYNDAAAYHNSLARIKAMRDLAVRHPAGTPVKGMVALDRKAQEHMAKITEFFDEAHIVFGDNPVLKDFEETFKSAFRDKTGEGSVAMVPEKVYNELMGDLAKSSEAARKFIDKPTDIWRYLTLNIRPAWLVNNAVGQLTLLLATHGLYGTVRGLLHTLPRSTMNKLIGEKAGGVLEAGFSHAEMSAKGRLAESRSIADWALKTAKTPGDGLASLNKWLTDDVPRRAAFYETMRPYAKRYQKEAARRGENVSLGEAIVKLMDDDRVLDEVSQKVLSDLVDFRDLSTFERAYIRRLIPFYSWVKGMNKRTAKLVLDEPGKALVGARVGEHGNDVVNEGFGFLPPSFMRGALLFGKPEDGKQRMATTYGLNPFSTPADTAAMIHSLTSGDLGSAGANPVSMVNPIFKAIPEALYNKQAFGGFPVDPYGESHGFAWRYAKQLGLSTPVTQSLSKLGVLPGHMYEPYVSKHPLYGQPSWRGELEKFLGVPLRTADLSVARQRGKDERKLKTQITVG